MIVGIGIDMIEIERIRKALEKDAFMMRCFTDNEILQIGRNASHAAGNFAVKEAVSKVFGTGFRTMELKHIEVLRDDLGKPYVLLYREARRIADSLHINRLHVSISNTKTEAVGMAVGEK